MADIVVYEGGLGEKVRSVPLNAYNGLTLKGRGLIGKDQPPIYLLAFVGDSTEDDILQLSNYVYVENEGGFQALNSENTVLGTPSCGIFRLTSAEKLLTQPLVISAVFNYEGGISKGIVR